VTTAESLRRSKIKSVPAPETKLKSKAYLKELRRLQAELCKLQDWAKATGERAVVVFEGRDAAGKGGAIRAITERVSPRCSRSTRCPRLRTVRRRSCTRSATSRTSPPPVRS